MRMRLLIPFALFLFVFAACSSYRPMAHVIVYNNSDTGIPINVSISHRNGESRAQTVNTVLRPGFQELDARKFSKGSYHITAAANNGTVAIQKNLALDTDRWIIITYNYSDSLNLQRTYGYVDTAMLKKINGKYAGLDMYIENRKPPTIGL